MQYWSFFKSGKFAFLALFFVSLTVISCDNDDDNNVSPDPPIEKGEIELAEKRPILLHKCGLFYAFQVSWKNLIIHGSVKPEHRILSGVTTKQA